MRWAFSFEFSSASAFLTNDERTPARLSSARSLSHSLYLSLSLCLTTPSRSLSLSPFWTRKCDPTFGPFARFFWLRQFIRNNISKWPRLPACLPLLPPPLPPSSCSFQSFRHSRFCLWHICQCGITNWWLRAEVDKIFHFICFYLYFGRAKNNFGRVVSIDGYPVL